MTVWTMIRYRVQTDCGLTRLMKAKLYSQEGSITLPSLSTDFERLNVARIEAAAIQRVDLAM